MVILHHVKPHASVVHNVQGKVVCVNVSPSDREIVVVFFMILVFFVLPHPLILCVFQRPVDSDEVTLDQPALVICHLNGPDRAAEFPHHLCRELFGVVRLYISRCLRRRASGDLRGFFCSCHFSFLP